MFVMHIASHLREASTALPCVTVKHPTHTKREWREAKRSLTERMRFIPVRDNSRHVIKHQYCSRGLASTAACWETLQP